MKQKEALRCIDLERPELVLSRGLVTPHVVRLLCSALATNVIVRRLDLSHNRIGDDGAEALGGLLHHNAAITGLNLAGTGVTRWGLEALARGHRTHTALTDLDLASNSTVDDVAAAEIARLLHTPGCQLRRLNLLDTAITANGAVRIAEGLAACPSLTEVRLPFAVGTAVLQAVDRHVQHNIALARGTGTASDNLQASPNPLTTSPTLPPLCLPAASRPHAGAVPARPPSPRSSLFAWSDAALHRSAVCVALLDARRRLHVNAPPTPSPRLGGTPRSTLGQYLSPLTAAPLTPRV